MGGFKKGGDKRFGGNREGLNRRDSGRGGFGGGRDRGPVTMHQATCDQCGKSCEVPFKPTSGKPVYCSACFEGKKEIGDSRGGDRFSQKSFGSDINKGSNNEVKKQLEILNGKMDTLIKVVESMAGAKSLVSKSKPKKVAEAVPAVKAKKIRKK
jgi:CxxC-x17-CxxC domain-containing protein